MGEAFHLNPGLIEWSTHDSDLDSVRDEPAFQSLVEVRRRQPDPSLDGSRLHETLSAVLGHIMPLDVRVEYRLVGTAAALLHGVQLPVADIDLLVRERQAVHTCSFVNIPCGAYVVPTVALELRLVSELYRNRPERYTPLIQFMQSHGCATDLLRRGMAARGLSPEVQNNVLNKVT